MRTLIPAAPPAILPACSQQAWETLIAKTDSTSHSQLPIESLQISALPGAPQIANLLTDDWVIQYEHLRESVERKQRTQGQVQTGVFYTPSWVARYLTQQTLGHSLRSLQAKIQHPQQAGEFETIHAIVQKAQAIRILDPACGTGVFLVEALHLLTQFYQQAQSLCREILLPNPTQYVLQHQLYGIDIDPISIMITELRLAQHAYRLDGTIQSQQENHLHCGNTLLNSTFPDSLHWDFILGNPPYVSETRKQAQRFQSLQTHRYYQAKMDLCDAFTLWSIEHLKPQGQLAFVLPEYWTQRSSSQALRSQIWTQGQLLELWQVKGNPLFKNAPGHHTSLMIWQKQSPAPEVKNRSVQWGVVTDESSLSSTQLQTALFTFDASSGKLLHGNPVEIGLLQKLGNLPPLLNKKEIQQGIVIPQGRLKKADALRLSQHLQESVPDHAGVFLLNEAEIRALRLTDLEQQCLKPYYLPTGFRAFQAFSTQQPNQWIIYGDLKNRKQIETAPEQYPQLRSHLDRYRTVNTSAFAPYGLHRARQPEWFENTRKIFCPRQVMTPAFATINFPAYVNEAFYSICTDRQDAHFLCGILNSKLAWFWFYHHKRKGQRLQIDKEVLAVFPAPPTTESNTDSDCIQQLAQQLAQAPDDSTQDALNQAVYRLYQLEPAEIEWIETAYQTIVAVESASPQPLSPT